MVRALTPALPFIGMQPVSQKTALLFWALPIGAGYLFPTTFERKFFQTTGERGILMGALAGVMEAQYNELLQTRTFSLRSVQRNG